MLSKLSLVGVFVVLTSCGDGGAAKSTTAITPPSGLATAASVQLLVSNPQMLSSASAATNLTAIALDANGQAISGKLVIFSKGADTSSYFSNVSALTSANGTATATLNIGTDMTNRVISVTASADGAVSTSPVTVTGTKIAISGNTSLAANAQATLTVIVKDSTGVVVPGVTLTAVSQNANPVALSPTSGITDNTGQITVTVTATNAGALGTDFLTLTGAGTSQIQKLTINTATFSFTAPLTVPPATTPEIPVGVATSVTVQWFSSGVPQSSTISFATSRGSFSAGAVATTGGIATSNITATSTGATIITATGPGGTPAATLNVVFITATASTINIQASPSTVAINASGGTGNQSVISVVVRDAVGNLVKNAHVTFGFVKDPSGGSFTTSSATTDITGTTSVNFIAGGSSSPQNGEQIMATVDMVNGAAITPISATVNLTVASQALYVRLGTDNQVYKALVAATTYTKQYSALVTDAAGNPSPDGTPVRFVVRPAHFTLNSFFKGRYIAGTTKWIKDTLTGTGCINEDANLNGVVDVTLTTPFTEDLNGNGIDDPNGVATVNATANTVGGFAIANITYPQDHATWVQVDLEARAGVIGNDPPTVVSVILPGADVDYNNLSIQPPGVLSPYGVGNLCTDMN